MGKSTLEVLRGVDLSVQKGEFLVIIGASGSGKSTLLHILGALDRPTSGTVEFDGIGLNTLWGRKLDRFRNKTVGFVFQFYHLLNELSVLENVLVPAMASSGTLGWLAVKNRTTKRAEQLLEQFGLKDRLGHKPYELSGGERQRTALARALINQPALLLADEPTGNLDSATGSGILEAIAELHRAGQTIVMVTHDERIAARAGRVIRLSAGKMANVKKTQ
jgi:ABC-type lipoprotein export system ATPase subunit